MMSGTKTPNGDMIADQLPDDELLQADGLDSALIGYAEVFTSDGQERVLAYDRDKCIESFMEDGMDWTEANEYFDFNVAGSYVGEKTPVFVTVMID